MPSDKLEKLKDLLKLLQNDTLTPAEVRQFLTVVLETIKKSKDEFQNLSAETKQVVNSLLQKTLDENAKLERNVSSETSRVKKEVLAEFTAKIKETKSLMKEIESMKPQDGKDADETKIVEDVLSKIPKAEPFILKRLEVVEEINRGEKNSLKIERTQVAGLDGLVDETRLNRAIGILDQRTQFLINRQNNGEGGNSIWGSITGTLSSQTDLQNALNAKQNTLISGTTIKTINSTSLLGSGDIVISIVGTINQIAYFDTTTSVASLTTATYPSLTELSYVKGVTSALQTQLIYLDATSSIQTQLNTKAPLASPTFSTSITGSYLTASQLLATDGSKNIVSLAVATYPSLTELTYLKGVTSAIQTQFTGKQASSASLTSLAGLTYVSTSFVKMTGAGTFALDTNTYLTSLSGAVLTDQTVGQTIGATGARLTKLWATDITVSNAIVGSITGNAGTVSNATLTTALTVNTGTLTLTANVANTSVLTIGAGAVSVSGANTGDQTTVSGNAGTATALQNARTIGGVNFDGTANITVATATGGFTVSGGNLALGTNSITMSGSIGVTGTRVTKGWFTDLEVTNVIVGSVTGNAATVTTNANLTGHITSVGNAAVLGTFTLAQLNTAVSDANLARIDAGNTFVGASTASAWVLTSATITTNLSPTSNDGAALGTTALQFSDLFLAEGGVINWDNGDVTLTQVNNTLTVIGGAFGVGIVPTAEVQFSLDGAGLNNNGTTFNISNYSSTHTYDRPKIDFYKARGTAASPTVVVTGDYLMSIEILARNANGTDTYCGGIDMVSEGTVTGGNVPTYMSFVTCLTNSGVERMRINSTGTVLINNLAGTGSRAVIADASGVLTAPVSDETVKENINTLDYGLKEVMALNPVSFTFKEDWKNMGEGRQVGLIAQQVEKIIPEVTFTTPTTGKMGINYEKLVPVLIRAIQELQEQIKKK